MNFVIVGTNFISDTFLKAALITTNFTLYGLCSRKITTANKFLKNYPKDNLQQTKIFTSITEVCADNLVDAVYLASPNHLHASQTIRCLNANIHVLGEKPSASNSQELKQIIAAAKHNKCLYMEALMTTHLPNFNILKKQLPRIGKVRKFLGQYSQYSSRYDLYLSGDTPNWCRTEYANGALVDLGIYPLSLITALWGKPTGILASGIKLATGVDGAGDLLMAYHSADNAKQAVISYSKICNGDNISEFQGELGSIEIEFVALLMKITLILNDGTKEIISTPFDDNSMKFELQHFISLVEEGKTESQINSFEFSEQIMAVMDEARKQMQVVYPADEV
ncbi:MAG: Gfo/Idh/MocA family oxidoreductase [Colwellia sp.]|nr:Gfo/Idh/MocA family oxidoreductase [Colwellia sp.]